jgi:hypothetical protein
MEPAGDAGQDLGSLAKLGHEIAGGVHQPFEIGTFLDQAMDQPAEPFVARFDLAQR